MLVKKETKTKEETKPDPREPFTNCLENDAEYVAAQKLLLDLKEQAKRADMAFSFGEIESQSNKANTEAVESVLAGVPVNEVGTKNSLMTDREIAVRKIGLLKTAIQSQEQKIKRMEPDIWLREHRLYEPLFREMFEELIQTAEAFHESLHQLMMLQTKMGQSGIPKIAWPAEWQFGENWFRRFGVNPDGRGLLSADILQLYKNWPNYKSKKRTRNEVK